MVLRIDCDASGRLDIDLVACRGTFEAVRTQCNLAQRCACFSGHGYALPSAEEADISVADDNGGRDALS
jgi:hypothetical protein